MINLFFFQSGHDDQPRIERTLTHRYVGIGTLDNAANGCRIVPGVANVSVWGMRDQHRFRLTPKPE